MEPYHTSNIEGLSFLGYSSMDSLDAFISLFATVLKEHKSLLYN